MDELIKALREFTSLPDVGAFFTLKYSDAKALLATLDRLRAAAGAVSHGQSFSEIRAGAQEASSHTVKTTGC